MIDSDELEGKYFSKLAAAFVRGKLQAKNFQDSLLKIPLSELNRDDQSKLISIGEKEGLKLHKFKRTMGLQRVSRVLGILRGLNPASLLDVGSGRGVFLWPLLDAFPELEVRVIEINPQRVDDIDAVNRGGITNVSAQLKDISSLDADEMGKFDVVTMLEVLEHIADPENAIRNVLKVAGRFALFSVPLHEDDNPEHIHLFDSRQLAGLLEKNGSPRVKVDYVHNHMVIVAAANRVCN